jgi:putative oxidoreductase
VRFQHIEFNGICHDVKLGRTKTQKKTFMKHLIWIPRVIAAIILLQTLYFKFTGHPDSVYIFETVGMEPYGRIGSGVAELLAGVLLLIPRFSGIGALISLGVISGAIFFHLTSLGIEVNGDSTLFYMAIVVFICSVIVAIAERKKLLSLVGK